MVPLPLLLLLSVLFSCDGGATPAPVRTEPRTLPPPFLQLPVFVDSRLPLVDKQHFSPASGTGLEPLPGPVREVLLPVRTPSSSSTSSSSGGPSGRSGVSVKTLCKVKKMVVQVQRAIFSPGDQHSQLKLGTCQASKTTEDFIYFEYELDECGTARTISNNQVAYSNLLRYDPPSLQGPIRRAAPFTLPVACHYNRYLYSYKIGYTPKLRMRKIFKPMKNSAKFILTPRNARWERLSPSDSYVLGKPMYFEAEAQSMPQNKRLYVHSCYATPEKSHTSTPQFPVVNNFGCMVESKDNRSRFIPYKASAVRFSVDAFIFKGMTGRLYMHCSMSVGSSIPAPTAKSCNYDTKGKRWVELYGSDSVCTCCNSDCSSATSTVTKMISSSPWTVDGKGKPKRVPKRKKVFTTASTTASTTTTTTTTTITTAAVQPETAAEWTDSLWPFGGGVTWDELEEEEEEEEQVKGLAVVEDHTEPRRIFEELFDFGK